MSGRPLGITLLALGFGFVGVALLVLTFDVLRVYEAMPSGEPLSLAVFVTLSPLLFLVLGLLGLAVAAALWYGHPFGRTGGMLWVVLWIVEEALMVTWAEFGPDVVRELGGGGAAENVLRISVGLIVLAYLWSARGGYLERRPEPSADW